MHLQQGNPLHSSTLPSDRRVFLTLLVCRITDPSAPDAISRPMPLADFQSWMETALNLELRLVLRPYRNRTIVKIILICRIKKSSTQDLFSKKNLKREEKNSSSPPGAEDSGGRSSLSDNIVIKPKISDTPQNGVQYLMPLRLRGG